MMIVRRRIHPGDTRGSVLLVHLPESIVRAERDGSYWVARVTGNQSHRLRSKKWEVVNQTTTEAPAPTPAPAPVVEPEPVFDVLNGTVAELEDELDAGVHDDHLAELLASEIEGKNRRTAVAAITDRLEDIAG